MNKLLIISFAFLLTVACTKQRESQFAQGQGENLLSIESYNGKTFEITTGTPIAGQQQSFSKAQKLVIKAKAIGEDSFSVVNYDVTDPLGKKLLGNTPIVGKANSRYKGLIKVEQNYVKVYKVAKAADLPLSETTYAVKLDGEELAVPLIGYPITSRVSIDRSKNEYGEKGSTKIEKSEDKIGNASYFRLDMSRGQIFEAALKTDVLPASFLNGEWFYAATVTGSREERSEELGFPVSQDEASREATRVKFVQEEESIKAVNLNIDERLTQSGDVNYKTALSIPVEWKSYKVSENGAGLSEQEDSKIHWSKRPFAQMHFDQSKSAFSQESTRLVNLEMEDDYFSFVTENRDSNQRIRYAFSRVKKSNYKPKILFKEDNKIFGFFASKKSVLNDYKVSRQEDVEKTTFISRFNTANGKIVFHFTKTTPDWIRPSVQLAVEAWDQAFKDAGLPHVSVELDSKDVELGDLRYNAINIIETQTASSLFGFGPSLKDPNTGEIISATTNVHLTPIRMAIIRELKTYIKMKIGLLEDRKMVGISSQLAIMSDMVTEAGKEGLTIVSDSFPALKGLQAFIPDEKSPNKYSLKNVDFRNRTKGNAREFDVAIASGNIHEEIEKECSEIKDYVAELKSSKLTHNEKENDVLDSCSRKLVTTKLLGTLVHEMGHNFGLRHNFLASTDEANFYNKSVTGTERQVRSSSIMEYTSFNEDRLVKPGLYDIAAIRFGYGDAVELKDGRVVKIKTELPLSENLRGQTAKAFKYCTDEDVELAANPLCQRHDAGTTPLEIVKNIIADYQASYQLANFRGDALRTATPGDLAEYRFSRFFLPMLRFYSEWRAGVSRYLGQEEQYLERLDAAQYEQKIAEMAKDPQYATFVAQYRPVADAIFAFFFDVVSMEDRYCVVAKANQGGMQLDELEKVRANLFYKQKAIVKSCAEANQAGYWDKDKFTYMTEIGQFMNSFRYDLSPEKSAEPLDVIGTAADRFNAILALTQRMTLSYDDAFKGLRPSMMDEPAYRDVIQNYLLTRTALGIPGSQIAKYVPSTATGTLKYLQQTAFPKFTAEKDLLTNFTALYLRGLAVPGNAEATNERKTMLNVYLTGQPTQQLVQQAVDYVVLNNAYAFVMDASSKGSVLMMSKYKSLNSLKDQKTIDLSNPEILKILADLRAGLPTDEEIKTMTVEESWKRLTPLKKVLAAAAQVPALVPLVIEAANLFQVEVRSVQGAQKPELAEQIKTVREMKLEDFMTNMMKAKLVSKETLDQRVAAINGAASFYTTNRSEIDSQVDLIRQSLMLIGTSMYGQ